MYKKCCLLVAGISTLHAYTSYTLVPSAHDEKVVIRIRNDDAVAALEIAGQKIEFHNQNVKEIYLEPRDAVDFGIRHQRLDIVDDALNKLAAHWQTIDIITPLTFIRDHLIDERNAKYTLYGIGAVSAIAMSLFLIATSEEWKKDPGQSALVIGVACAFTSGTTALAGYLGHRSICLFYAKLVNRLATNQSCTTNAPERAEVLLAEIRTLMTSDYRSMIPPKIAGR